jgi:hypothetical protein
LLVVISIKALNNGRCFAPPIVLPRLFIYFKEVLLSEEFVCYSFGD